MKLSIYGTAVYGILVLLGGLMGYFKAGSKGSLIMGTIFGLLLIASAVAIFKRKRIGWWAAIGLSAILVAFFSYRLFITHNFMPASIIIIIGLWLMIRLCRCSRE